MSDPSTSPPPFDASRALVFALGVGVPVIAALSLGAPLFAVFAGVGAFTALMTDPRRSAAVRAIAITVASIAIFCAAWAGLSLRSHPDIVASIALALVLPVGLIPPTLPWFALVAKLVPVAILFAAQGVAPDPKIAEGFLAGAVAATLFSLLEARWRKELAEGSDPRAELKSLWDGRASNGFAYASAMTAAAALALFVAMQIGASRPVWAFITVLFVMHPQGVAVVRRLRARVAGTLAGVLLAGAIVHLTRSPWLLAIIAIVAAGLFPVASTRGFFASSAIATLFVLIMLDIAFLGVGGDTQLIVARFLDTLVGCGAVLLAVFALRRYRAWRGIEPSKGSDAEIAEPAHGTGAAAHDAGAAEPGAHF